MDVTALCIEKDETQGSDLDAPTVSDEIDIQAFYDVSATTEIDGESENNLEWQDFLDRDRLPAQTE